jgi:hypothetical protein
LRLGLLHPRQIPLPTRKIAKGATRCPWGLAECRRPCEDPPSGTRCSEGRKITISPCRCDHFCCFSCAMTLPGGATPFFCFVFFCCFFFFLGSFLQPDLPKIFERTWPLWTPQTCAILSGNFKDPFLCLNFQGMFMDPAHRCTKKDTLHETLHLAQRRQVEAIRYPSFFFFFFFSRLFSLGAPQYAARPLPRVGSCVTDWLKCIIHPYTLVENVDSFPRKGRPFSAKVFFLFILCSRHRSTFLLFFRSLHAKLTLARHTAMIADMLHLPLCRRTR